MTIRCEIVSQDRTVFQGDVDIVILPGVAGEMGILPHHAPVLTILKYGVIKIRKEGKEELFSVAGGMAEVQPEDRDHPRRRRREYRGDRYHPRPGSQEARRRCSCEAST